MKPPPRATSRPVIAGLAAAIYLMPVLPTTTETREFLDAYAATRGRPFSPAELQRCWAAALWTRAYEAKQQLAAGQPVTSLTPGQVNEWLREAGLPGTC